MNSSGLLSGGQERGESIASVKVRQIAAERASHRMEVEWLAGEALVDTPKRSGIIPP